MAVQDVADGMALRIIMKKHDDSTNKNKLLVLEFKASWSEPCKYMKKVLDGLASEPHQSDVKFYALDIAVFKQFTQRMRVEALPKFLLLKGYKVMGRVVGVDKEELTNSISQNKKKSAEDNGLLPMVNPDADIDKPPPTLFTSPWAWLKTCM